MLKILVCGGREYASEYRGTVAQRKYMWAQLDAMLAYYGDFLLIHGGAGGADSYAGLWAEMKGVHTAVVRALWAKRGNSAGPQRNSAMVLLRPDIVVAFPGGPGTANMVYQARHNDIPVYVLDDEAL